MNHNIVFIAPYKKMGEIFNEVAKELNLNIPIYIGDLEEGAVIAVELEEKGVDVIISRGGTALAIESKVMDVPVVGVNVSGFDLIRIIYQAKEETNRIAVVGFDPFTSGIKQLGDILDVDLKVVTIKPAWSNQPFYIEKKLEEIKAENYDWIVGDNISVKIAKKIGMNALLIRSGKEAFAQVIKKAQEIAEIRKKEKKRSQKNKSIIDYAYEGIINLDQEGIIITFNPKAEQILNKKAYKVIGKDIDEVFPECSLKEYLQSKIREQNKIITLNEKKIVANIIPVLINEEVQNLVITFQKVSNIRKVEKKLREELYLKGYTAANNFSDIIGKSKKLQEVKQEAKDYAQVDLPLLIYGETGTGKELFAQSIHNHSHRRNKPFVAFNCAALPEKLIESELFGYVKGAFTGAKKGGKEGLLEQGNQGTIFLDEIEEVSLKLQARFLRFLEERKIRKIGDNKLTPVDVRIILATNRHLEEMVKNNEFREDFYYRINVLNLNLPSLRERKEDISELVDFFIKKVNTKVNSNIKGITKEGLKILKRYDWPGNVRQLENVIEKLVIRTKGDYILTDMVRESIASLNMDKSRKNNINDTEETVKETGEKLSLHLDRTLKEMQQEIIERVIEEVNGNKTEAARRLGIGRTTLWRHLSS
ncbi:MAG: sigma 54-interacting transcriptional regulator [Halanaerobiales bacterium]|nr:sigma 54-interacting transcriptional regulator [Halanaerobiales bacterium]